VPAARPATVVLVRCRVKEGGPLLSSLCIDASRCDTLLLDVALRCSCPCEAMGLRCGEDRSSFTGRTMAV